MPANYERRQLLDEIKSDNSPQALVFKKERKEKILKLIQEVSNIPAEYMTPTDFELFKFEYAQIKNATMRGIVFGSMDELLNAKDELDKREYFAFIDRVKKAIDVSNGVNGFNVYLWGDKGNGKSHLVKEIARKLNREIIVQNFAITGYDFQGITDIKGDYHYSLLEQAYKYGKVLVFEEMDGYDATALIYLNSALEQGYITTRTGEVIYRHPNTLVFACGNTDLLTPSIDYTNRNTIDIATADRFLRIKMPNFEYLNRIVSGENYKIISDTIDNLHGRRSVRNFVRLNKLIQRGMNLQEDAKAILE